VITIFLLWMVVAQLGLFTQGLDLLGIKTVEQTTSEAEPGGSTPKE
jgi:hypothetical protein